MQQSIYEFIGLLESKTIMRALPSYSCDDCCDLWGHGECSNSSIVSVVKDLKL
jgi:hypothetical protein